MDNDREGAIEARAYQLWEETGRPHGMHDEHWRQAEREFDAAAGATSTGKAEGTNAEDRATDNVTSLSSRDGDAREDTPRRRPSKT